MKILYYCPEYYCNYGARTHARSFFDALTRHPFVSKAVIVPKAGGTHLENNATMGTKDKCSLNAAKKLYRLYVPRFIQKQITLYYPSFRTYRELSSAIIEECPDAVVLRLGGMFRYIERLRHDFGQLKICIEYNATIFDESSEWIPALRLWRRAEAHQLEFADSVSVVSKYLHRYLVSLSPALNGRVFVNPNGVDTDLFKPMNTQARLRSRSNMRIPTDAVVLGYAGGMEPFRRLPEVVRQVAKLRRQGLDRLYLVMIGTGKDIEKVRNAVAECSSDLSNRLYLSNSWLEHERIPSLMAAFDIGLFPYSNPYGFPQKILEYMSCGLPVVGPDVPAVTEQFDKEHLPFLVRQDGSNFEKVVRHVYENLVLYKTMALRGRTSVDREFTWFANASRIIDSIGSPLKIQRDCVLNESSLAY